MKYENYAKEKNDSHPRISKTKNIGNNYFRLLIVRLST